MSFSELKVILKVFQHFLDALVLVGMLHFLGFIHNYRRGCETSEREGPVAQESP